MGIDEALTRQLKRKFGERVRFDEPMFRHTSMKTGGPADVYAEIESVKGLRDVLRLCAYNRWRFFLIGGGTNTLFRDGGLRGVVAKLTGAVFRRTRFNADLVSAGAAVSLNDLIREAAGRAFRGLEKLAGIYGSVGGAVAMNAGAHGAEIGDLVEHGLIMDADGTARRLERGEMDFSYRSCGALKEGVLLGVDLRMMEGESKEIQKACRNYERQREIRLPKGPSAGCVFKNPEGKLAAGEIIEMVGLKGARRGGVAVSDKHANVIVNLGGARTDDVISLIDAVSKRVYEALGIRLEREVVIVGEDKNGGRRG